MVEQRGMGCIDISSWGFVGDCNNFVYIFEGQEMLFVGKVLNVPFKVTKLV
jgi:hypothetical protein